MPDQKISVDPAAADLSGCIIPVVTGGINKQAAASLFGITGVANGVIYSAGNRNTSDPTNFNYVPGTQTLTVVGPIRTSPVTNEATVVTPANGMIIYSTALSKFRAYENGAWVNLIGGSGGAGWALTGVSTLTGVATITSNAANQHIFNGTWSASAAADAHITFGGTLTAASALGVTGYIFNPTLNALGTSSVQVGVDINPTFAGGTTPVNIGLRVRTGGVILGNFSAFQAGETLLIRNDQNATNAINIFNNTSGTAAKNEILFGNSTSTSALRISSLSAAFTTSGIFVSGANVIAGGLVPGLNVGTVVAGPLALYTSNTERARFLSTGEFLVGYTSILGGELVGVRKDQNAATKVQLINGNANTAAADAYLNISVNATPFATHFIVGMAGVSFTSSGAKVANTAYILNTLAGGGLNVGTGSLSQVSFWTNNVKRMAIDAAGNTTLTQPGLSSAWLPVITFTPGAHTSMTATAEFIDYDFSTRTATWLAGTTATQRFAYFRGQTVAGASASATFTDLYTVYIDPSVVGANAVVTNNWALGLGGGLKLFAGTTTRPALVIPTGTNLTTSQAGAMENDGTHLWFTFANSGARWQLDNQVGTFGWALAGNTLVADGIIGDVGTGGFKISLYTNNTARQVISSKGNFTFTQDAQSATHTFFQLTQSNHTGGTPTGIIYIGGSHTALATAVPTPDFALNLNRTVQFGTGTFSLIQKAVSIDSPTYSFVGASTMIGQCGLYISGPPKVGANATTTSTVGLLIDTWNVVTGGGVAGTASGLEITAPTGANANYAARFFGGTVVFAQGTTTYAPLTLQSGGVTLMTTPAAGSMEYNSTNLFFTPVSTRLAVSMNASAATPATTGTMTTTLTNLSAITITPTGACTFNASGGISGQRCAFVITTSGASSFVLTWGTNYKTTGTLATGTVTAKVFTVEFVYDGTNWNEVARTVAM